MAKKLTLTVLLLCIIGSSSIWAWDYPEEQGTLIGTGIGLLLLPMIMGSDDTDVICYTVGGIFIGVGVLWMILDISLTADAGQNPDGIYLASGKTESISISDILRHTFVGYARDKFSLGFWYSY